MALQKHQSLNFGVFCCIDGANLLKWCYENYRGKIYHKCSGQKWAY